MSEIYSDAFVAWFVAEACEASGVRPRMAVAYRALKDRLVLGEPAHHHDAILLRRGREFLANNADEL